jgi:hypothetical protein
MPFSPRTSGLLLYHALYQILMNKATTQKEKAGKKRKEKINQNVHNTSLDC